MWIKRLATVAAVTAAVVSFLPSQPEPPPPRDGEAQLAAHVDSLLAAAWERRGITPPPEISDAQLHRRASIDLHATIPSLPEIVTLEAEDSEGRRERLVARLVADPRFADTLADELATWFCGDEPREGLDPKYRERRFRLWIQDQLLAQRGYADLVREIISSSGLPTDTPAINFITGNRSQPERLASRLTSVCLGLQIGCAQCHDHPFADWTQDDFEALAAFFARVEPGPSRHFEGEIGIHDAATKPAEAEADHQTLPAPGVPFESERLPRPLMEDHPRQALAEWITGSRDFARATVSRVWQLLLRRGLVEPFDDLEAASAADPALENILDLLADDFVANHYDLQRLFRVILLTRAYGASWPLAEDVAADLASPLFAVYEPSPLRSRVLAFSLLQATSLRTLDAGGPLIARLQRFGLWNDLVEQYGDPAQIETVYRDTIPRVLTLMNAEIFNDDEDGRLRIDLMGSVGRINRLASNDSTRLDTVWRMTLMRRPDAEERARFQPRLEAAAEEARGQGRDPDRARALALADITWAVINSSEFQTQH